MVLAFNDNHIIYYQMVLQQSIGWMQTYFVNHDYLVVQDWLYATFLSPDTVNQTESHVCHCTFFYCAVGYPPLGLPCIRVMAVISFANAVMPYVFTASLAL